MKPAGPSIARLLSALARRVRAVVARGVIRLVDDERLAQETHVDILRGESRSLERFAQYGFTSVPHAGAEGVVVFVNGDRSHGVVIACEDRRYRLKGLAGGEVALYDDLGTRVVLRRGGRLELVAPTSVEITTPVVSVSGDLVVGGDVLADGDVADGTRSMAGDRAIFNSHTHAGVESGGSLTDPPLPLQ